jgi:hypothetical protein
MNQIRKRKIAHPEEHDQREKNSIIKKIRKNSRGRGNMTRE